MTEVHRSHTTFPQSPPSPPAAPMSSPMPAGALPAAHAHLCLLGWGAPQHSMQHSGHQQCAEPWLGIGALKKKLQKTEHCKCSAKHYCFWAAYRSMLRILFVQIPPLVIWNALFLLDFPLKAHLLKYAGKWDTRTVHTDREKCYLSF